MTTASDKNILSLAQLVIVSVCRLICGLIIVKVLSYVLGPAQFGQVAQVLGISTLFYSFAGGGITNGLILQVGQTTDQNIREQWLVAALIIGSLTAVLLAVLAMLLYFFGGDALLNGIQLPQVFLGIAIVQSVVGVGNILLAYASGVSNVRSFASANIAGTLMWAGLTVWATLAFGFDGAVWALIVTPAITSLIISGLLREPFANAVSKVKLVDRQKIATLVQASGLMVLAICALPAAQTLVRADMAMRTGGWHDVGLWQSIARLSDAYMQVFGVIAINLLLPHLLRRREGPEKNSEMMRIGSAMLALFIVGAVSLYILREPVLLLAFSAEFLPAQDFLLPQLGGDFAKVAAWILIYRFVSDGHLWVQTAAELMQSLGLVAFYYLLFPVVGPVAAVTANMISCIALLIGLTLFFVYHLTRATTTR